MTMLDVIGALCIGAIMTLDALGVIAFAAIARPARIGAAALILAWLAALVAVAATGLMAPYALRPVGAMPLSFVFAAAAALIAWNGAPRFRAALLSVPLAELAGVHAGRVVGVFLLILFGLGRLPAPFAPLAGIGDIITALAAIGIVVRLVSGRPVSRRSIALWNAFGALDLVVAVTLGVLSTPGTLHVFGSTSGNALTSLPWLLIPTALVPFYLLTHLTIAAQLGATRSTADIAFAA
jgi:hypothetical protein